MKCKLDQDKNQTFGKVEMYIKYPKFYAKAKYLLIFLASQTCQNPYTKQNRYQISVDIKFHT